MKAKKGDKIIITLDGRYNASYTKGEIWDVFDEGFECVYACQNGDTKNYTLLTDNEYEIYSNPSSQFLFQIGDVVRITPGSEHYSDDLFNPKDTSGRIIKHEKGMFPYSVEWDNGYKNSYRDKDLFHYVLPCINSKPIFKPSIKNGDKVICIKDCVNIEGYGGSGNVYINKGEVLTGSVIYGDFIWFNEKPGSDNGNYPIACFEVYTGVLSSTPNPCSDIILDQFKIGDRIIATSDTDVHDTKSLSPIKDGDTIICVKDCINFDYASSTVPVQKGEVLICTSISGDGDRLWCTEKPGYGKGTYPAKCFQVHTGAVNCVPTQTPYEKIPIKVGDMVEVTKRHMVNDAILGMIGRVAQVDEKDEIKYLIETPNGQSWCVDAKHSSGVPTSKAHSYSVGDIIGSDYSHDATENLVFQTPIIVKKPNKKRNLVIINN